MEMSKECATGKHDECTGRRLEMVNGKWKKPACKCPHHRTEKRRPTVPSKKTEK